MNTQNHAKTCYCPKCIPVRRAEYIARTGRPILYTRFDRKA